MKKNRFAGRYVIFFLGIVVFSTAVFSCKENADDLLKPKTITDVLIENDQFSIFREIVEYAGMSDALRTDELTLFAPDNNAFGKANIFNASKYMTNEDSAEFFVQNYILPKRIGYSDLKVGIQKAKNSKDLSITKTDSIVAINKSDIVIWDVNADNGVIHVIDSLLVR